MKTLIVFNENFDCILVMIDLYFLIPALPAQIFNPTTEFAIPIGTPTN